MVFSIRSNGYMYPTYINAQDINGMTALHRAVLENPRTVQALLDAGVNPNIRNRDGRTPLMLAIWFDIEIPALFESAAVDLNLQDFEGRTALHLATWLERSDAVSKLLNNERVDLTIRNLEGDTAWHTAIYVASYRPETPILSLFLESPRVDHKSLDVDKRNALKMAKDLMNEDLAQRLSAKFLMKI